MSAKDLALNLLIKAKDMASDVVRRFKEEVEDSGQAAEELESTLDSADASIDALQQSTEEAGDSAGYFADQLTDADKAAGRYYDRTGRLHEANGRFVQGARRARTEAGRLGEELDQAGDQAEGLSGRVEGLVGRLKALVAASAIGAGLKWFFEQSIGSAARFERQMNRVEAVTNATAEEMAVLEKAAEEAGSTTEYSAVQAAEGLEILGRAGFSARQSVELLPSVLAVAAAEGVDLAEAAGLISDTLAVMQLEVAKGAKVTDILARGSSLAYTNMSELGLAISYAGQYAKPANLDLEKLVAILDVLAQNSLRGERGGTGLRSILAQLSDPASKAAQAIKQLNLPTDDFIGLIEGLRQKGPEATEAINAFGIEAGPALRALIAAGSEGISDFEQKLRDVDGAAKQMADTATDDLPGGIKEAESAWEGLITTFGKPLLKPLTALVRDLAAKFRELKEDGNLKAWGDITVVALNAAAGSLKIVYNAFTLVTKAIGVFVTTMVIGVADAERAVAKLMNKVGIVSDETVRQLETETEALREVLATFVNGAEEDIKDMGEGWDVLANLMAGKVTLGVKQAGDASEAAGKQAEQSGQAAATAAEIAEAAAKRQAEAQEAAAQAAAKAAQAQSDAWKTLGHDIDEVTGSLTDSGSAAVTAFETIASTGKASAEQIELAFASALAQAKNQEDILALERSLQSMGNKGYAAAEQVANGLLLADRRAKQLANTASNALEKSLQALGVDIVKIRTGFSEVGRVALDEFETIQEEMKRTGITGKQAAEITRDSFKGALEQISTTAGLDELKAKLLKAAKEGRIGWDDYRNGLEAIEAQYDELEKAASNSIFGQKEAVQDLVEQTRKAGAAVDTLTAVTESSKAANDEHSESTKQASGNIHILTEAAVEQGKALRQLKGESSEAAKAVDEINQKSSELRTQFGKMPSNVHAWVTQMRRASEWESRELDKLIAQYKGQEKTFRDIEQALTDGRKATEQMLDGLHLLDQQKLDGLKSQIRSARQEAESFTQSIESTVSGLQQQLADLQGDQVRSEQIAQEQRMLSLRQKYDEARDKGNQDAMRSAQEALSLQQEIHRERMRQIQARKNEESSTGRAAAAEGHGSSTPAGSPAPAATPIQSVSTRTVRVELALNDSPPFMLEAPESEAERLLSELAAKRALS